MENLKKLAIDHMKLRVMGAVLLVLILSVIMPIKELRWSIFAASTPATLVSVNMERRSPDSIEFRKRVSYEFNDNGVTRSESDLVTSNWPIAGFDRTGIAPPGLTVQIEYIPGSSSSRLMGHDDKSWYIGSSVIAILTIIIAAVWWKFRGVK